MTDTEEWRAPTDATFNLTDLETGEPYTIRPSVATLRSLYEATERWGLEQTLDVLLFGAASVKREVTERDARRLRVILEGLVNSPIGQSKDLEEFALWRSYTWLLDKQITREQAAQYASDVLGRPITKDAWRMAVDRWAAKQHLPKVEYRRRKRPANE